MILHEIEKRLGTAVGQTLGSEWESDIVARPCANPKFGDYQSNALMPIAKKLGRNPREVASEVVSALGEDPMWDSIEIAGPGFLNIRLSNTALAGELARSWDTEYLFVDAASEARKIVIDFSSPNVAKPMHVGHIRSTILGDALARVFRALGHEVITDNHIGDWGTQFGKLLLGWKRGVDDAAIGADALGEMERLYKSVNDDCERDEATLDAARAELVALQSGDPENLGIWHRMLELSQGQFDEIYGRLDVRFDHTLGESFYNDRLAGVVNAYLEAGLANDDEGAAVVFFEAPDNLKERPLIIRKSDGAANYATTDLATLEYRLDTWDPDEIVYVTDGRQQLHFQQIFQCFRNFRPEARVRLSHVWFGAILGPDGRPFKTRSGETVRLSTLLDEAESRGRAAVEENRPELEAEVQAEVGRKVGLGAVKFADLLPNRQTDYRFEWDKMLSFEGTTAPYVMYAYTRTAAIHRKFEAAGGKRPEAPDFALLVAPEERALATKLLLFGFTLECVAEEYRPNYLCNYLVELAADFSRFYQSCPVLKAEGALRDARFALSQITGRTLQMGLELLGIETSEVM